MYVVNDIEPARVLAFLGALGNCGCPDLEHRYGKFPLEGQSRLAMPFKSKTLSPLPLVCRVLHNVAKTKKNVSTLTEKRVYSDITIGVKGHIAEEREPGNEAMMFQPSTFSMFSALHN